MTLFYSPLQVLSKRAFAGFGVFGPGGALIPVTTWILAFSLAFSITELAWWLTSKSSSWPPFRLPYWPMRQPDH